MMSPIYFVQTPPPGITPPKNIGDNSVRTGSFFPSSGDKIVKSEMNLSNAL